jgi:hypothetical protein
MESIISSAKVVKELEKIQIKCEDFYKSLLLAGDLLGFESALMKDVLSFYNQICQEMLQEAALSLSSLMAEKGAEVGMTKLQKREVGIKISTGFEVKVSTYYACSIAENFKGSRYSLLRHWGVIQKCSPSYYDKVGMSSIISPSYLIGSDLLTKMNVGNKTSHTRELMNKLGLFCADKEEYLSLSEGETVSGKRIVISIDGGRTRTREYSGDVNEAGNKCYAANWREPKLFVIDVLDDSGKVDAKERPIYGCRFEEGEVLDLFARYLVLLNIKEVESVQIIADGAPWIWQNIKAILLKLGVEETKIIETLDYCHAMSYVHLLIKAMPKNKKGDILTTKKDEKALLKQAKEQIWKGQSHKFIALAKQLFKKPNKEINQAINYLEKHKERMQYANYQLNKLMCGSGIIESGIRRIVNLRFKNPSTFWSKKIVEKLYLFRAILVSNRWNLFIQNLAKAQA